MGKIEIHPVFSRLLTREHREGLIRQKARVIWFTGFSGAGKTTIAAALEKILHENGFLVYVLDGDNVRTGINKNLGFSEEDRLENIRRIAEVCKLFTDCGIITLASFVSPTKEIRNLTKMIIGPENFTEVFVNASLETCEKRDVKGLYKKAREGGIKDFTGISAPFEAPINPDVTINSENERPGPASSRIFEFIHPLIKK